MKFLISFTTFLTSLHLLKMTESQVILTTPVVTNYGTWKDWQDCPDGTYVTGMDVTTFEFEPNVDIGRTIKDKLGLVDIIFQCSAPNTKTPVSYIFTKVGGVNSSVETEWIKDNVTASNLVGTDLKNIVYPSQLRTICKGSVIGLQLMNDIEQISLDNTAANNIRIYCSGLRSSEPSYVEGYGTYDGFWTDPIFCGARQAMCGIQTSSQDIDESMDQSAINHIRIKCCDVPNPLSKCEPKEEWELVQECDNYEGASPASCGYSRKVGVSSLATGDNLEEERDFYNEIGYSMEDSPYWIYNAMRTSFANNLTDTKNFDWSATGLEIWDYESSEEMTLNLVPEQHEIRVYQLVGICSHYSVRTPVFRQESSYKFAKT